MTSRRCGRSSPPRAGPALSPALEDRTRFAGPDAEQRGCRGAGSACGRSVTSLRTPCVMDRARPGSRFQSDLDFCPDCGSILPLPGAQDTVTCVRCGFRVPVRGERPGARRGALIRRPRGRTRGESDFEGKVVNTCIVFNKLGTAVPVSLEEGPEFQGPVVDRRCSRCGHEGMAYHTRQMRSADEGQTVFYTCTNCSLTKNFGKHFVVRAQ
ncbi:hypothetical protein GH733_017776 [Mirounga leonina]|nr:hypothetical protein GH733_017776 [Mirounga leonina]